LILLAILPPLLWLGWTKYEAWRAEQERQKALAAQSELAKYVEAVLLSGPPLPPKSPPPLRRPSAPKW
jgi:hypothetical protein